MWDRKGDILNKTGNKAEARRCREKAEKLRFDSLFNRFVQVVPNLLNKLK